MQSRLPGSAAVRSPPPRGSSNINQWLLHAATKPLLFTLCLMPLGWLVYGVLANTLGANPAEALIRSLGDWTLRFLCITLAITPVRTLTGWHALARWRRMLGLFSFFYASLHFLAFAWLDMGLDIRAILADIPKRPFILVGTLALLLMLPLAATSFNRAIKTLGAARWQALHRLIYATVLLGLLHFFWMRAGKNDFAEVGIYAAVIATLLGWRLWRWLKSRASALSA
jgi:sulfoxide reductase heme-binding subunit YedZ